MKLDSRDAILDVVAVVVAAVGVCFLVVRSGLLALFKKLNLLNNPLAKIDDVVCSGVVAVVDNAAVVEFIASDTVFGDLICCRNGWIL